VCGGLASGLSRITLNPGRDGERVLHSKVAGLELKAGDVIRIETLGGGGYGPPAERPIDLLAADLREGKVSLAAAERDYGVALTAQAVARNSA
jgi:N-methylhydantoinase B